MDREAVKKLKKDQEDAEEDAMDEEDVSDEEMEDDESDSEEDNDIDKTLWGEAYSDTGASVSSGKENKRVREIKTQKKKNEELVSELSDAEKYLLMEEFKSSVFSNFIQGKDTDFDYR